MKIIRGEVTHGLCGHDGERRVSIIAVETARLRLIVPTLAHSRAVVEKCAKNTAEEVRTGFFVR